MDHVRDNYPVWSVSSRWRVRAAQGGCGNITYTLENYQPCCYRLQVSNASECYPQLRLLLDVGSFVTWGASIQTGWTGELISSTEILLTHNSGMVPIGASTPIGFCLPPGVSPVLTILYDNACPPGEGCFAELPIMGCPIVADACISGVKYVDLACAHLPYTNQPTLPGWTITLLNTDGIVLDSAVTDNTGSYQLCDLPPGNYVVKETSQPGWSPSVPPSGQYNVTLSQSEQEVRNFGNCPTCACDSLYMNVVSTVGPLEDTCAYNIVLQNSGAFCFDGINVSLGSGKIASWQVLLAGWTVVSQDSQHLRLIPPGGFVPLGASFPLQLNAIGSAEFAITLSSFLNTGGVQTECKRVFVLPCPRPPEPPCCPVGSVQGPNLVTNGHFELGLTGFTTQYTLANSCSPGMYNVVPGSQVAGMCGGWNSLDHTSGLPAGKMLVVDGSQTLGVAAYRSQFTAAASTQYAFCAYFNNLNTPNYPNKPDPIVQLWLVTASNVPVIQLASMTLPESPDAWIKLSGLWTSPPGVNVYKLEIRTAGTSFEGNNFAVDDVSIHACSPPPPCQAAFTVSPIGGCGKYQFTSTSTNLPTPVQYCWDFDNNPATCESTLPNPMWQFPTCGTYNVCLTITGNGCSSNICQTVVVADNVNPVAVCQPGVGVILNANCTYTVPVSQIDGGSTDNCLIKSITVSPSVLTGCQNHTVTLTVTDWCNNTSTCTTGIQTAESVPPTIMCPLNITIRCDQQLSPMFTGLATATDLCSPNPTINYTDVTTGQMPCNGTVVRTWTATDLCLNTADCTQVISVQDNIPPTINCPPNTTVNTLPGVCYYAGSLPPQLSGSDNCRPVTNFTCSWLTPTQSILITPLTQFPKGPNNITCFAQDACGNTSPNCNFILTVRDNQPPVITCPASMSIVGTVNAQGQCKAVVNGLAPTVTDNCPMVTTTYTITGTTTGSGVNNASGTNFMQGISTITYTATDMGNNTATCSFTLNVKCPPVFCDSIGVTSMPFNGPQDTCCFKLTMNNLQPNYFTAIQLCASNGVSISNVSVLNGCGLQSFSASQVTVVPAGGIPNTFPVGSKDFIKFCLSNYQNVPNQQVIVKYYGPNYEVVCMDTLNYNCTQKPKCLKVTSTVECGPNGTYQMNFCVMANPLIGWNVASFVLNPPAGVTFTPATFTGLNIPPGGMQCNFTTTVSGNVVDGQTICYSVTAHAANTLPPINCCTDTVMQACATMPVCVCSKVSATAMFVNLPPDVCCWKINLTNGYSNTYFTGVQLNILTPGVVFGAITNPGFVWNLNSNPTQATLTKLPVGTYIGATATLPTFCLAGITSALQFPQQVQLQWLGPNGQVVCVDTLTFDCPPPVISDCAVIVNPKIQCHPSIPGSYIYSFQVYNNSGFTVNEVTLSGITPVGSIAPSQFTIPALLTGQTSGVISTLITGVPPGGQVCFYLTVHQVGPNGNELFCCTHSQKYCYTMPECPNSCICGPFDILYSVGHGPLLPKPCGDTLTIPSSPNLPIAFLTSFQCYGINCPQPTVDWVLTGPAGFITQSMNGVLATPGFTIPITNATFYITGLYTLTMTGHCGTNLCPCTIYFYQPNGCCQNYEVFCQNVENAVSVTLDTIKCKATLNIGNLPGCDQIQNINWGDGTTTAGPFVSGAMPMHTYSGTGGTYVISWLAVENNNQTPPQLCFEKLFRDTITLDCDTCQCKSFSPLSFFNSTWSPAFVTAGCNEPVQLPCLRPGQNPLFIFHGNLNCTEHDCLRDSIQWAIIQMPAGSIVASGSSQLNPLSSTSSSGHFDINLQAAWFSPGVQYMLTVTGACGSKICTCKVSFTFAACPCPCDQLEADVKQGFKVLGKIPSVECKKTFMPISLCASDVVTWTVNGVAVPGTTTGNGMKMITFNTSGLYTVCMKVVRTGPNGQPCPLQMFTYCQKVIVKCSGGPDPTFCSSNVVKNGDFAAPGLLTGHLGSGGFMPEWSLFPNPGTGFVLVDSAGASDDGQLILNGGQNHFAGIYQLLDLPAGPDSFVIIEYYVRNYSGESLPAGTVLEFRLQSEPFPGSPSQIIGKQLVDHTSLGWMGQSFSIPIQLNPDKPYLVICLQSQDSSARSAVGIDNLEICTSPRVGTGQPEWLGRLRVFPNPNAGHFSVELPPSAPTGMTFRIVGLTGQLLREQPTQTGISLQTVQVNDLPPGLYFLQVVADGRVLAVEKFVKE